MRRPGYKCMEELNCAIAKIAKHYLESQTDYHICASTPSPSSTDSPTSPSLQGLKCDYPELLMLLQCYPN